MSDLTYNMKRDTKYVLSDVYSCKAQYNVFRRYVMSDLTFDKTRGTKCI